MIKSANLGKELLIKTADKAGILAGISRIMADHGINIEGVAGYVVNKEATIMLVVDDALRAKEALDKGGYKVARESEVVVVELENKAGALKVMTSKLGGAKVEMTGIYGTTCAGGCAAKIILTTNGNEKAVVALNAR